MKEKLTDWLTILLTGVVGVLFIFWHGDKSLFEWLVRALGLVLLVPGIYEAYVAFIGLKGRKPARSKKKEETGDDAEQALTFGRRAAFASMLIVSAVAVVAGLWMMIDPATFVGLLAYLLAAMLVLLGIYQIVALTYVNRTASLAWYFYIVPVVFVVAGAIILFMSPDQIINTVAMLTGILLVISALNSAVQMIAISAMGRQRREDEKSTGPKQLPENVD